MHPHPVWADRVNFIANSQFAESAAGEVRYEQLSFEKMGDGRFKLCCIPFFTYGYSLGDIISLKSHPRIGLVPGAILERGENWSLRVLILSQDGTGALYESLKRHDAEVETRGKLIALSVAGVERLASLRDDLDTFAEEGLLAYETIWL